MEAVVTALQLASADDDVEVRDWIAGSRLGNVGDWLKGSVGLLYSSDSASKLVNEDDSSERHIYKDHWHHRLGAPVARAIRVSVSWSSHRLQLE